VQWSAQEVKGYKITTGSGSHTGGQLHCGPNTLTVAALACLDLLGLSCLRLIPAAVAVHLWDDSHTVGCGLLLCGLWYVGSDAQTELLLRGCGY
jgi:hypothetical protein